MATTNKLKAAAAGVSTGSGSGGGSGGGSGYTTIDISASSYNSVDFDPSQMFGNGAVELSADGTKMYIQDHGGSIYQYSMSTAFDLSTISYASKSYTYTQDSYPYSTTFKSDGTSMYMVGDSNNTVYQYSLSTPWDVSSASYASKSFSFATHSSYTARARFSADGTKMFSFDISDWTRTIFEHSLSTAWDVSTASYSNKSMPMGAAGADIRDFDISPSGTQVFSLDKLADNVRQYDLTTAFDVSSGSFSNKVFSVISQENLGTGITFNASGTKFYIYGDQNDKVHEYLTNGTWIASSGGGSSSATYVQDVFNISTYTGTGSAQSIVTDLDMATDGGLVWLKSRTEYAEHQFYDTERGATKALKTGSISASITNSTGLTSFNTDGFSIGSHSVINDYDGLAHKLYVGWSFKKHASFFDVQTWTGDGTNSRSIGHALNHDVGCIMIKSTSNSGTNDFWWVWHKGLSSNEHNLSMNSSANEAANSAFHSTAPTSTDFYVSSASQSYFNTNGHTYVAYIFADNNGDGIFGANADQDIIRCGVYTGDGTALRTINVGFEAELILTKRITNGGLYDHWKIHDQTRGMTASGTAETLYPNLDGGRQFFAGADWAQTDSSGWKTGTGSNYENVNGSKYIYIAIRKTMPVPVSPTSGLDIDSVFSTYLYSGNGSTQTINNGIDLSGQGGLVWTKYRGLASNHRLTDTEMGGGKWLESNSTAAITGPMSQNVVQGFTSSGFTWADNASGYDVASFSFRKAAKFFDILTWTGDGTGSRTFSHNLDCTVGMILVKRTSGTEDWTGYHRGSNGGTNPEDYKLILNSTNIQASSAHWASTAPTSTNFTISTYHNVSGHTYVAYLFAHNDGDGTFGPAGDQDIIKCGSFTTDGSGNATVDLGWEPQFVITKSVTLGTNWNIWDPMRGWTNGSNYDYIAANSSAAETGNSNFGHPTATGFTSSGAIGNNSVGIYIAIRRGPLDVPTDATKVFDVALATGTYTNTTGFPVDLAIQSSRASTIIHRAYDRLRGGVNYLETHLGTGEPSLSNGAGTGHFDNSTGYSNYAATLNVVDFMWRRAPGHFDAVAWTGNGTAGHNISHSLDVVPEMMWVKRRDANGNWRVYHSGIGETKFLYLNTTAVVGTQSSVWNDTAPTNSVFTLGTDPNVNTNGGDYIAYLFASAPGVSKVGSVTHSGTTNVDCGFSSGARFVLLKRTDATGDWYVWDSERGIVSGNDPSLLLNTASAEVTNTDYIDPLSSGFTITGSFTAGDYIFYAIA